MARGGLCYRRQQDSGLVAASPRMARALRPHLPTSSYTSAYGATGGGTWSATLHVCGRDGAGRELARWVTVGNNTARNDGHGGRGNRYRCRAWAPGVAGNASLKIPWGCSGWVFAPWCHRRLWCSISYLCVANLVSSMQAAASFSPLTRDCGNHSPVRLNTRLP